ncbi:hypothetical protein HY792_04530 [Candidatus Desantisbacteria bacterium]|nr:hypothetical protein [Candidatus Desantisbacteria bacterium]
MSTAVIISCLFIPVAYGYEDFSGTRINSPDDIWELVDDGEISYEYAQILLGLYDNPFSITSVSKEDLSDLSILSPEETEKLLEYQRNLTTKGIPLSAEASSNLIRSEDASVSRDVLETIKPFLNQQPGGDRQDNRLRLTHSSYQQGQTSESLKISFNPETQLYLWNKDTHNDSLSKYCLEFQTCAVGYYFLRFGEGLVLNNGSRQSGSSAFHDTLWRKSRVMRGVYLTKLFNKIQSGLFFSCVSSDPYTLSLKGFDHEQLVGCHSELQIKRVSVGYTGYASKLEAATTTTARGVSSYSVMGPYLVIDTPAFQISGESAWYYVSEGLPPTNTNGYGWIVRAEKAKTPAPYDIGCFVYSFDKGFCTPYGHISGIEKMQDAKGYSAHISRFFKGRLSTIKASYDYSRNNNYRLWIMACYKLSKRIRTKWWIDNTDKKTAYTERIFWDITPEIYSTLGLRQEKNDDKNRGYVFLESTYTPHPATAIKARIKWNDNMVRDDYKEYSLQLAQQLLKQHIKLIGRYTLKEYQDNTNDCRTNLEIEKKW